MVPTKRKLSSKKSVSKHIKFDQDTGESVPVWECDKQKDDSTSEEEDAASGSGENEETPVNAAAEEEEESDEDAGPSVFSMKDSLASAKESEIKESILKEKLAKKKLLRERQEKNLQQKKEKSARVSELASLRLDSTVLQGAKSLLEQKQQEEEDEEEGEDSGDESDSGLDTESAKQHRRKNKRITFDDHDDIEHMEKMFKSSPASKRGVHVVSLKKKTNRNLQAALHFKNQALFTKSPKRISTGAYMALDQKRKMGNVKKAAQLKRLGFK